jgi:HPt (histidine-containing phosphotransfer) domain-containing protein
MRSTRANSDGHRPANKTSQRVLDMEWLSERCNGDSNLMSEVLRLFSEQCQLHLDAMQNAIEQRNGSEAAFHAEFLAGAAANIGAADLRLKAEILYHIFSQKELNGAANSNMFYLVAESFRRCLDDIAASQYRLNHAIAIPQICHTRMPHLRQSCSEHNIFRRASFCQGVSTNACVSENHKFGSRTPTTACKQADHDGSAFPRMRQQLDAVLQHNDAGRELCARAEALTLSYTASGVGCWMLAAAAARAGMRGQCITQQLLEEMELRLDTATLLLELQQGT